MQTRLAIDDHAHSSTFATADGCEESFVSIAAPEGGSFPEALAELTGRYSAVLDRIGLSDATAVFCRIFLSDVLNQKGTLLESALYRRLRDSCALSIIEQKPLGFGPVALLSYHVRDPKHGIAKQLSPSALDGWRNDLMVKGRNYSLLFSANHTSGDTSDTYAQTRTIFDSLNSVVEQHGMTLLDNGIRTWVFIRDLDNHYQDMVRARRECFAVRGLTDQTRYLASTGIEGVTYAPERMVSVDALSLGGLSAGQVVRMEALSHMRPTIVYGVTFERGLRVRFGDRSHLYVAGTASINSEGEVLHEGSAELQARRALENVRALLEAQSATLDDLAYAIVYVRNAHDLQPVTGVIEEELGGRVPLLFAEAAVCRPAWLMEIEGMAIVPDRNAFSPFL
jgi:enamine deaminase RidA (YjgF/YER057c/UK114 family)